VITTGAGATGTGAGTGTGTGATVAGTGVTGAGAGAGATWAGSSDWGAEGGAAGGLDAVAPEVPEPDRVAVMCSRLLTGRGVLARFDAMETCRTPAGVGEDDFPGFAWATNAVRPATAAKAPTLTHRVIRETRVRPKSRLSMRGSCLLSMIRLSAADLGRG
jgi:hypothetical protein